MLQNSHNLPFELQHYLTSENITDELLRCICEICCNILKRNIHVTTTQYDNLYT